MVRCVWLLLAGCFSLPPDPTGPFLCSAEKPACQAGHECVNDRCVPICADESCMPVCANAVGHDEDNDTLDDACDPCPHLAGDATDSDRDGVGEFCDPHPSEAVDRIEYFDAFTSLGAKWQNLTKATLDAGTTALHMNAFAPSPEAFAALLVPNGETRIVLGGTVVSASDPVERQISTQFGHKSQDVYHAAEVYTSLKVYEKIGTGANPFHDLNMMAYDAPIPTGRWSIQIDESVAAQTITLGAVVGDRPIERVTWDAKIQAPMNPLSRSSAFHIFVKNLNLFVDYILVIETERP